MSDSILSPFAGTDINGGNGGKTLATSAVASAVTALGQGGGRYMFTSYTTNALIKFGISTMTAATTADGGWGMDIPAGAKGVVDIPASLTHFSVIADGAGSLRWGKVGNP